MGGKSEGEQTLSVSRKEVKYLLSLPDRLYLLDALDRLLTPDAYGGYNGYIEPVLFLRSAHILIYHPNQN